MLIIVLLHCGCLFTASHQVETSDETVWLQNASHVLELGNYYTVTFKKIMTHDSLLYL